jgi:hypothetical protein
MKVLHDHVLLYDEVCPLCTAYSCMFVRAGILDANGRAPYQRIAGPLRNHVDFSRATDEIALVNTRTGEVVYGVASLMRILETSFPPIAPLFRQRWFGALARVAYRFISFNRRVIMPARDGFVHQPSFNAAYRTSYLLLAWVVTASFLHKYSQLLVPLIPPSSYGREFLICGGQIFWQLGFMVVLKQPRRWDYLGTMMTISLAGGIALGLIQLLSMFVHSPFLFGALFTGVAGLMMLEHIRRTGILQLSGWLTITWILYRIGLLAVILWLR